MKYYNEDKQPTTPQKKRTIKINPIVTLILAILFLGGGITMIVFGYIYVFGRRIFNFSGLLAGGYIVLFAGLFCSGMTLIGFLLLRQAKRQSAQQQEIEKTAYLNDTSLTPSVLRCPKCLSSNAESAKFCDQCGTSLVRTCSRCGAENPPETTYCEKCGARLR